MPLLNSNKNAFGLLVLAGIVFLVLSQFQTGRLLLWPFIIFTTFIHELGHGLTAIVLGGDLNRIEVFPNAAGLAKFSGISSGLPLALVAMGGLLAPSLSGALFIISGTSKLASTRVTLVITIVLIISCLLWVRNIFGLTALLVFTVSFILLIRYSSARAHQFLIQFLGIHMLVDTLSRTLRYLFSASANVGGQLHHSDTGAIAANLGGNYLMWAIPISLLSFIILAASLRLAYFK